jgi:hypothetical protein
VNATFNRAEALARVWREKAQERRAVSPHDTTADVFDYCATEMLADLLAASLDDEELTPAEYGALPHINKSASQVRRWCQFQQIPCTRVGRDYRIRRGTPAPAFKAVA